MKENFIKTIVSVTAGVYIYIFIKLCFRPFDLHQIYGHGQNNQTLYTIDTTQSFQHICCKVCMFYKYTKRLKNNWKITSCPGVFFNHK